MDPLSAVASIIAIGQALTAVPKIVEFLRSIPEIQDDLLSLNSEIETLQTILEETSLIQNHDALNSPSKAESTLLQRTRVYLQSIVTDLEKICVDCSRSDGANALKPRKFKWVRTQKSIEKMHAKARNAQLMLQTALLLEIRGHQLHQPTTKHLLQIENVSVSTREEIKSGTRPQLSMSGSSGSQLGSTVSRMERMILDDNASSVHIRASVMMPGVCPKPCHCQCHFNASERRTGHWLQPVIGSLILRYSNIPIAKKVECNEEHCQRQGSSIHVNYSFPSWICSRVVSFRSSLDGVSNIGASLHLSVGRVLPGNHKIWLCIKKGTTELLQDLILKELTLYPTDVGEPEIGLIEYAISHRRFDIVEFLLVLWSDWLQRQGCGMNTVYTAYQYLLSSSCGVGDYEILQKVVSAGEVDGHPMRPAIHEAAIRGNISSSVPVAEFWAINSLDYTGLAPLHLAVWNDNEEAVRELLCAGADVDQMDWEGETPLMYAVSSGYLTHAQCLVNARCDVHLRNIYRQNAVHHAVHSPSRDSHHILDLILSSYTLTTAQDTNGHTPLHLLANVQHHETGLTEAKAQLLLKAGADIECRNCLSNTPLLEAITYDNLTFAKVLVDANARLDIVDHVDGYNVLHFAAIYSNAEVCQYLDTLQLSSINAQHRSSSHDTPWDLFIFTINRPYPTRVFWRDPDEETKEAFEKLYRGIRNRNLESDISHLEGVLAALKSRRGSDAIIKLQPLIQLKENWKMGDMVETYRTIKIQVREEMWEAAVESVEENIDILKLEMATSPWQVMSKYGIAHGHEVSEVEDQPDCGGIDDDVESDDEEQY